MLSDADEVDARLRWTASLMNLHNSSPASAAGHSTYDHATYQPSMTTSYTDCSRPMPDLTGYSPGTAQFNGYRYMTGASPYNIISSSGAGSQASTDRFQLQRDLWAESITSCISNGMSYLTLCSVNMLQFEFRLNQEPADRKASVLYCIEDDDIYHT